MNANVAVNIDTKYVHISDGTLVPQRYDDGSLALQVQYMYDGYPEVETLSVNLSFYGLCTPDDQHIWVKDYAENEGLPAALIEAGIATEVRDERVGPFNTRVVLMRLTEAVL